ncbi:MAG: hypothetical protein U0892_13730 [Pirellulales bacterium]
MKNSLRFGVFVGAFLALTVISQCKAQAQCCGAAAAYGQSPTNLGSLDDPVFMDASALLNETDDPAKVFNLIVVTPEKSVVSINGEETFTKGSVRKYIARGAKPGAKYKLEVVGKFKNEFGAEYEAKETVMIEAGGTQQVVLHLRRVKRTPPPVIPMMPPAVNPAAGPKV